MILISLSLSISKYGSLVSQLCKTIKNGQRGFFFFFFFFFFLPFLEKIILNPFPPGIEAPPDFKFPFFPKPLPSEEKVRAEYHNLFNRYCKLDDLQFEKDGKTILGHEWNLKEIFSLWYSHPSISRYISDLKRPKLMIKMDGFPAAKKPSFAITYTLVNFGENVKKVGFQLIGNTAYCKDSDYETVRAMWGKNLEIVNEIVDTGIFITYIFSFFLKNNFRINLYKIH
jgi:hypothetical protein